MSKSACRDQRASAGQENAESRLFNLYRYIWSFCAGWNRVAFRGPQFHYIKKRYPNLRVRLAPLGDAHGMVVLIGEDRFININRRLLQVRPGRCCEEEIIAALDRPDEGFARFVFLHEIGHLLLHQDRSAVWTVARNRSDGPIALTLSRTSLSEEEARVADAIREVEADFYALVAMVPDYLLMRMLQDKPVSAVIEAVARVLGGHATTERAIAEQTWELAQYRVSIFERFSHAFRDVSEALAAVRDAPYRSPLTIERVRPFRANHRADLLQIAACHPVVAKNATLLHAVREASAVPFETISQALPFAGSAPLTHKMDLSRLVTNGDSAHEARDD